MSFRIFEGLDGWTVEREPRVKVPEYVAIFPGPGGEGRAREYAKWLEREEESRCRGTTIGILG